MTNITKSQHEAKITAHAAPFPHFRYLSAECRSASSWRLLLDRARGVAVP